MKIVFMEAQSLGDDMDLSRFSDIGDVIIYDVDTPEENAARIQDADIVVMNKIPMNEGILKDAKNLKLICITATGTDCVDTNYTKKRGIAVSNVRGYSTESVVQHTFAMLFYVWEKSKYYDHYVKSGAYEKQIGFGCYVEKFHELAGKTWGIIGLGAIGKRVAQVAEAFGCHVIYYSTSGKNRDDQVQEVSFETLLEKSDIISIHAPLNDNTREMMNREAFVRMKKTAVLLNLGRGGIIHDEDLVWAVKEGEIGGVCLDVINGEPIKGDNPLNQILTYDNVYITPHIAWATVESRSRCVEEVYENMKSFLAGTVRNEVK